MKADELLDTWLFSAEASMALHYKAAQHYERRHYWLGVPALVLSTAVGTTVFAALSKNVNVYWQIATGCASLMAAVLMALQTFLGYNHRAANHQSAGASYAALIREIHQQLAFPTLETNELRNFIDRIRVRFDTLSKGSPAFSERLWKREGEDRLVS